MTTYTKYSVGKSVTNGSPLKTTAVPASTTDTILGISCCNTYSTQITVTVELLKADTTAFNIAKAAPIPVGDTLWIGGDAVRHVVEATDTLRYTVNTSSGTCDFLSSFLREA